MEECNHKFKESDRKPRVIHKKVKIVCKICGYETTVPVEEVDSYTNVLNHDPEFSNAIKAFRNQGTCSNFVEFLGKYINAKKL